MPWLWNRVVDPTGQELENRKTKVLVQRANLMAEMAKEKSWSKVEVQVAAWQTRRRTNAAK